MAPMYRTRLFAAILIAAAGALAFAAPSRAQEKASVGVLRFVSSGGLFLAVEKGYFKAEGLDVELKFFEAAQPIALAVVSGDVDFGVTAFTGGFFNLAGKGALKIIAAQAKEAKGYEGNLVLASKGAAEKGFTDIAQFAGKTLGISQVGSSFHYQIGQLARLKGFDLAKVDMKPLQSLPNMMAALKSSQVDGIIIAPHLAKALIASGDAKLLGRYSDFDEYQFGGLFAGSKTVANKRALVEKFVRAYQKGAADYYAAFLQKDASGAVVAGPGADEAAALIAKSVYPGEPAETAVPKVRASAFYVDPQARLDVADLLRQVEWYKQQGLVDQAVDAKSMLDLSFIKGHLNAP
ncbi:ABC transporter substrate-binding protein [Alsobacter sp. KACC 23698]|uniref:ABC transporter substrate-binding protein n=1 Tax=Alsobacter sp. KACC 23698 TaxID=3149229 RepID=A0AAU7JCY4_9HYPH